MAADGPSIVERYPVADWPVGPPHEFSPKGESDPKAKCGACGATQDRAIHSEAFWRKYDRMPGPFPTATEYVAWIQRVGSDRSSNARLDEGQQST